MKSSSNLTKRITATVPAVPPVFMGMKLKETRKPSVKAALRHHAQPVPVCSVNTRACTAQRLVLAGCRPLPLRPRPPSPASRPARHRHCLCHRQPCGFNNSIDCLRETSVNVAGGSVKQVTARTRAPSLIRTDESVEYLSSYITHRVLNSLTCTT